MATVYDTAYLRSIEDPDSFWAEAADVFPCYKQWD